MVQHWVPGVISPGHGAEPDVRRLGLLHIQHFNSSPSSGGSEWKAANPLPTLESYWDDVCKSKSIENKNHFAFLMTKTAFPEEHKRGGFSCV